MGFFYFNNLIFHKMIHTISNYELDTLLEVDETLCKNTCIRIIDSGDDKSVVHYLSPKDLNNLIGTLLHVQAKKRKEYKTPY